MSDARVNESPVHLRFIRSGLASAAHARTRGTRRASANASSGDDDDEDADERAGEIPAPGVQRDARHRIMPERTRRPGARGATGITRSFVTSHLHTSRGVSCASV